MAAICHEAQFGMLPWPTSAEVTLTFKCGEEGRISLEAILSTAAKNGLSCV